jgi:type IV pilus assembly protein PilP
MIRWLMAGCLVISMSALAAAEPPQPMPEEGVPVPAEPQLPSESQSAVPKDTASLGAEYLRLRDPFKRPMSATPKRMLTELEQFAVEQYKLLGVMMGGGRVRAMLMGPNGKSYFVSQGEKIGTHNGVVRKITTDTIYIREKVVNVFGQEEPAESVIHLVGDKQSNQARADGQGTPEEMGE